MLKNLFLESFRPTKIIGILALLLMFYKPLAGWWRIHEIHKDELLSVTSFYRVQGDMQYFEILSAVSRGNFGELNIYESKGENVQGFPFASIILHAVFFAIFGVAGLFIADIMIVYLFFSTMVFMLRIMGCGYYWAVSSSLLVLCSFSNNYPFWGEYPKDIQYFFYIWGERLPRAFITEPLWMACFTFSLMLLVHTRNVIPKTVFWVIWGVLLGILLQSDIYAAFTTLIMSFFVVIYALLSLVKEKILFFKTLKGAIVTLSSFLVTIIPFIYQQFNLHPDIPRRFGVFPMNEGAINSGIISGFWPMFWIVIELGGILILLSIITNKYKKQKIATISLVSYCVLTCLFGMYSMYIFSTLTNKNIQLSHFYQRTNVYYAYSFWIFWILGIYFLSKPIIHLIETKIKKGLYVSAILGSLIFMVVARYAYKAIWLNAEQNRSISHARSDGNFPWGVLPEYRLDFNNLAKFLNAQKEDKQVLATLDHQVAAYWKTFNKKYTFVPDLFTSTVSDDEAEKRLILFCKEVGCNKEDFLELINKDYVKCFWFGLAKYQAHAGYTLAPLDTMHYTTAKINIIKTMPFTNTWHSIVPKNELQRIGRKFDETNFNNALKPRLDLLVITKDSSAIKFKVSQEKYRKVYTDKNFDVWETKK